MQNRLLLRSVLLTVLGLTLLNNYSCVSTQYESPACELCSIERLTPDTYFLGCNDPRLEEPNYYREPIVGDFCTNPGDYFEQERYMLYLAENLSACEYLNKKKYKIWKKRARQAQKWQVD